MSALRATPTHQPDTGVELSPTSQLPNIERRPR